ncbi:MAG: hypothetical protein LBK63_06830 [Treponema sp.]|nr:hypothetical protein [Treponema sp.]
MIHTLTRRPPREWVIEDFERLADEHPDKFHIQFILQDGTKVLLERKGFARPGEQEHKKDPYLE